VRHELREIGSDGPDLKKVSAMHMDLLGFGPMAGLGEPFIRKACYAMHMRDGSLHTALYEVNGDPAGFIAYTDRGISFHREGLSKHWLYAGLSLAQSLIMDPRRIVSLLRALRVVASRRAESEEHSDPLGEIVCIAVKREYLRREFHPREGVPISRALIEYAGDRLRECGVDRMRALVDAPNKSALMLYHTLGASFQEYDQAGEPMVEVWLEL
jgi:ribosomal protein S18 acetylase RimI-like enzyme